MKDTTEKAILQFKNKKYELDVLNPTLGKTQIVTNKLFQNGLCSYDPGFASTASTESKITYIDGNNGVLLYRGYPIEQLAEQSNYLEVCYLLFHGELPKKQQFVKFEHHVKHHTLLHEQIRTFFNGFRSNAHPMAIMCGVVGALSAFYHNKLDINDPQQREHVAIRLIAKMPTIAAMVYKYHMGQPFMYPKTNYSYANNFLYMLKAFPTEEWQENKVLSNAIDKIFILHADHEQNASTATVRVAGSTGANPYACIASGITALWGPLHGGANQAALAMLKEIGSVKNIKKFINKAKDKSYPFKLMGFGHRVYKNYDPLAKLLRKICHEL